MGKSRKGHSSKAGLPPGTLVHVGQRRAETVRITVMDYDEGEFTERQVERVEDCFEFKTTPTVTWINIDGVHDVGVAEKIGKHFDVHTLILEDILNTGQRPKFEDMEKYLFVVLKMLRLEGGAVAAEQVSLIVGANYVISFQEQVGDVFEVIRERIRSAKGRIRRMGADYLAYALLDAIVDNYFAVLENFGERIEVMEEELVAEPDQKTMHQIHGLKRQLINLRKSVWPLLEVIGGLERSESELIKDETEVFLRDVYDHTIQVIDSVETFRDMVSGMLDMYLSSVSNRMNEVMKVLTIFAAIFIPLTFIAGIYGMNFEYMPELKYRWGYFGVWGVIICVVSAMLIYFKRKKWL